MEVRGIAASIKVEVLEIFKAEDKYLSDFLDEDKASILTKLDTISRLLGKIRKMSSVKEVNLISSEIESQLSLYKTTLDKVVQFSTERGITYDTGVKGLLKEKARDLERSLLRYSNWMLLYMHMRLGEQDYIASGETKILKRVKRIIRELKKQASKSQLVLEEKEKFDKLYREYETHLKTLENLDKKVTTTIKKMNLALDTTIKLSDEILQKESSSVKEHLKMISKDVALSRNITIAISIFAIILTLVIIILLLKGILRPIKRLISSALKIADGDLSQTIDTGSRDEIGTLSKVLQKMSEQL